MKNIKYLGTGLLMGAMTLGMTSCNDLLDLEPITQITPESYYNNPDQLASYVNNYINGYLSNPWSYYGTMFHTATYNDGMNCSDANTDIAVAGGGSSSYFAKSGIYWEVGSGKALQSGAFDRIRVLNFFITTVEDKMANGQISGDKEAANHYLGEAYFLRAVVYFNQLAKYGDFPIITTVVKDVNEEIVEASKRAPRTEVADFILSDLDKAYSLMYDRSKFGGQRPSKEAAALYKSRVALFEGTFEKYHKGSGRVPGDPNWPGASMSYNSGKSFNIDSHVSQMFDAAMDAAKKAVNGVALTDNNGVLEPAVGVISGWNPYFEMYSQASLKEVPEVIFWKGYNYSLGQRHNAVWRSKTGSNSGLTRAFVESMLCEDGLPSYASPLYQGDASVDNALAGRDQRLQLFVWSESTILNSDPGFGDFTGDKFGIAPIAASNAETRALTGYMSRKYVSYDRNQGWNDGIIGENACPIFRVAEAMLNYIEACVEKTGSVDNTADGYWKALRTRAGVDTDYMKTVNNTDLSKELCMSVYSGTSQVSSLVYNVRRERMAEMFNEGLRFADLIRWRSFDRLLTTPYVPEGVNFWGGGMADELKDEDGNYPKCDGSPDAIVSGPEQGNYLRPYSRSLAETNELKNGYWWHEAYYLYPIGLSDIRTASIDRDIATSVMYQNINWPGEETGPALK